MFDFPVEIHVPGNFSVYNSLCAIAICSHFTKDIERIKQALIDVRVKGRVEIIPISHRFTLMIDYAPGFVNKLISDALKS